MLDEFLLQPIISTGLPSVNSERSGSLPFCSTGPLPMDTRANAPQVLGFDRPVLLTLPDFPVRELVADHFPIMTINHGRQIGPAIVSTGNMRHIIAQNSLLRLA